MRLSEKQATLLVRTLADSLRINDHANTFMFDDATRRKMLDTIINQQSDVLYELNKDDEGTNA